MEIALVAVHDLSRMSRLGGIRASKPKDLHQTTDSTSSVLPSFARHAPVGPHKRCRLLARFFCDDKGAPLPPAPLENTFRAAAARLVVPLGRDAGGNVGVLSFEPDGRGPLISRRHCALELRWCPPSERPRKEQWCAICVRDGGSLNGTFVNHKRLAAGESSAPVPFDPCGSEAPLLTLEFGVGSTLAPGASLSPAGLQLQFQVFSRCLKKEHVEWIKHRLGGEAFAAEKLSEVRHTKCLAETLDSLAVNTLKHPPEDSERHAFPSSQKFSSAVITNDSQHSLSITEQAADGALHHTVSTHDNMNRTKLAPPHTLPTPQNPPEQLTAMEGTAPNSTATTFLDTKAIASLGTSLVNYADSRAHAHSSHVIHHDVVHMQGGEVSPDADDGPVLVARKRTRSGSPNACVVSPLISGESHSQLSEKSGCVDASNINITEEPNAYSETDSFSFFLSQEERLPVALPRCGTRNVCSHDSSCMDSAMVDSRLPRMLPQTGKDKPKKKTIASFRLGSGVSSADAKAGTRATSTRVRRRGKIDATETLKRFVDELWFNDKEKESCEEGGTLLKDDAPSRSLRNVTRPVSYEEDRSKACTSDSHKFARNDEENRGGKEQEEKIVKKETSSKAAQRRK